MTKKSKFNTFIFFILIFLGVCVYLKVPCLFKTLFHIPCPGCGLTRGFKALFKLDIIGSFKYNILCIPLFIFIVYYLYLIVSDLINKDKKTYERIKLFFNKYYIIIIILIILSEIINIVRNI